MTSDEGESKKHYQLCPGHAAHVLLQLLDKEMALPGEDATVELKMMKPMVLEEGQNFTIRDNNGTIGTGKEKDTV